MKGVTTWRNTNGFFVCQIHYVADPDRDPAGELGKQWVSDARKGLDEASWRKEYEIDWFALSGEPVYRCFVPHMHCIEPFPIPPDWTRYMAIDPGLRNPTAALWAAVDPEGTVYLYDEHYVREKTINWHAVRFLEKEQRADARGVLHHDRIFIRLIDPAAANRSLQNKFSIIDDLGRLGIACKTANNDVTAGINRVSQLLTIDEATGKPRLLFFSTLKHTIREIRNYRYEDLSPASREHQDPGERPLKKDDHLMDCLRYIIMEGPHYVKTVPDQSGKAYRWDSMTTGYW